MHSANNMDPEVLNMVLGTVAKLEKERLSLETRLRLDQEGVFPADLIRFMLSPEVALHLIFIPAEYGGLGASASEVAQVSERMAGIDLGVATSFLAICLGMDPLRVGATEAQKEHYIRRIAEEGLIVAYAVTEPEAGSNVQSLKTKAEPVLDASGRVEGYRLNGQKQFITNGGVADLYTILADTPQGPSFFVVEAGRPGLIPGRHEDKHGIRASDTCPLTLEDLFVPAADLIGEVEGEGLKQANKVFGYTRLMVATFGLGCGVAALGKALRYSKERVQFGSALCEKQGYTHRLLVPHGVRLEAVRAFIEEVAERIDHQEENLEVEGSIAKYFATEEGDATANDAIQALGGYGYMREYEVEKIKRDVKILPLYEGTSEIQRNIISVFRMRDVVRSKGEFYGRMAGVAEGLPADTGGPLLGEAIRHMTALILAARRHRLSRSQYVMFQLADLMTWCEIGLAFCRKAADPGRRQGRSEAFLKSAARLFARECAEKVWLNGMEILCGGEEIAEPLIRRLGEWDLQGVLRGRLNDMDLFAQEMLG